MIHLLIGIAATIYIWQQFKMWRIRRTAERREAAIAARIQVLL